MPRGVNEYAETGSCLGPVHLHVLQPEVKAKQNGPRVEGPLGDEVPLVDVRHADLRLILPGPAGDANFIMENVDLTPSWFGPQAGLGRFGRDLLQVREFGMRQHCLAAPALLVSIALAAPVAIAVDTTASPRTIPRPPVAKAPPKVPQFPADVKALGDRLSRTASPAVRSWANQNAHGIAKGTGDPEALARAAVPSRWSHAHAADASDTLAFIANYEAAKLLQEGIKRDLDSMSEMGEMESLRLQMAMDRLSKLMSTLSNLLKKSSDTAQSIVQNLK